MSIKFWNIQVPSARTVFLFLFIFSVAWLVADALIQVKTRALPCTMDFAERAIILFLGFLSLVAVLQPQNVNSKKIFGIICFLLCCAGIYVASYHWWIQGLPTNQANFFPNVTYAQLQQMSFPQVLMAGFRGERSCASVYWSGGGLTMVGWTLLVFVILALISLFQFMRKSR